MKRPHGEIHSWSATTSAERNLVPDTSHFPCIISSWHKEDICERPGSFRTTARRSTSAEVSYADMETKNAFLAAARVHFHVGSNMLDDPYFIAVYS